MNLLSFCSAGARAVVAGKGNLRVLQVSLGTAANRYGLERVSGGLLVPTPDVRDVASAGPTVKTTRAPTAAELADLLFAWRVAKSVKVNATR